MLARSNGVFKSAGLTVFGGKRLEAKMTLPNTGTLHRIGNPVQTGRRLPPAYGSCTGNAVDEAVYRSHLSNNSLKSAGSSLSNNTCSWVVGCSKPNNRACNA